MRRGEGALAHFFGCFAVDDFDSAIGRVGADGWEGRGTEATAEGKWQPGFAAGLSGTIHSSTGARLTGIAALLGHEDLPALQRYLDLQAQDLEDAHRRHSPVDNLAADGRGRHRHQESLQDVLQACRAILRAYAMCF